MKNAELRAILAQAKEMPGIRSFIDEQKDWIDQLNRKTGSRFRDFLDFLAAHGDEDAMHGEDEIAELLR